MGTASLASRWVILASSSSMTSSMWALFALGVHDVGYAGSLTNPVVNDGPISQLGAMASGRSSVTR